MSSGSDRAATRPWLATPTEQVDGQRVAGWQRELDARRDRARREVDRAFEPAGPDLTGGVSVVVAATAGPAELASCLRSLAGQTLDPHWFEVIVVVGGSATGVREVIDRLWEADGPATVRVIRLAGGGAGRAYEAGAAAAGREYLTLVDGRDTVSPPFLAALLARAGPLAVPVAPVVEAGPDGEPDAGQPPAGSPAPLGEWGRAAGLPGGKLVATRLARAIRFDCGLDGGPEHALDRGLDGGFDGGFDDGLHEGEAMVFWATIAQRAAFHPCPADGVAYHRSARPVPAITLGRALRGVELAAELEQLAGESDPSSAAMLRRRIEAEADRIGDHLRRHPADHATIAEALDRGRTFGFPYARMNRGLDRGLVIAYAFPPYADASGIVMAKRIRTRRTIADVIYNAMEKSRHTDQTTRRISGPYTGDEAAIATPTYFSHWPSMEKFTMEGLRQIEEWEVAKGRYRWLYSRAHFAASHVLAAVYKLTNPAATWTAEFSDPLSRGRQDEEMGAPVEEGVVTTRLRAGLQELGLPVPESGNCFVWCEEVAYALADELVFTNEHQLEYMLSYCSDPELAAVARKKAVVSPHPTLPREFYSMVEADYPLEEDTVNLAYFGVFYATRGLDDVLTAIAGLAPPERSRLRLHVFTNKPEPLRHRADELGIQELVRVGPYADYLAFLNLTTRFDCLVVNDTATAGHHVRNPYLPSKWSDYKGSGTAVWGVVEDGSPLSRQPLAYTSPVGDAVAAREVLTRIVRSSSSESRRI